MYTQCVFLCAGVLRGGWKWKAYGNDFGIHSKLISFIRDEFDWSTRISLILFDGTVHKRFFFCFLLFSLAFYYHYFFHAPLSLIMLFNISKITVKSTTGKFVLFCFSQCVYTIPITVYTTPSYLYSHITTILSNQWQILSFDFRLKFNTRINLDILLFVLNVLCFLTWSDWF